MGTQFDEGCSQFHWQNWTYLAGQFASLKKSVRSIRDRHGVYILRSPSALSRVRGSSDVVYVGQAGGGKRSGKQGVGGRLFNTRGSDVVVRRKIEELMPGQTFRLDCACLDEIDPETVEARLLRAYFADHCELPPANHNQRTIADPPQEQSK